MAARLMMNYPSIVSCDEETYKAATTKLNKQDFESLPFKELKGIAEPGVIREYTKDHEYVIILLGVVSASVIGCGFHP